MAGGRSGGRQGNRSGGRPQHSNRPGGNQPYMQRPMMARPQPEPLEDAVIGEESDIDPEFMVAKASPKPPGEKFIPPPDIEDEPIPTPSP